MPRTIPLMYACDGLYNVDDPTRIPYDYKGGGLSFLSAAVNIEIDKTGRISRRKGSTRIATWASSDIYSNGLQCLFVSSNTLYRLDSVSPISRTSLRTSLTPGARMSYVSVDRKIYYANGYETGIVDADGVHSLWTGEAYVGTTTVKEVADPPIGHILEHFNGRIYIGQVRDSDRPIIWYTEFLAYSWVDYARDHILLSSRPIMIKSVDDGIFISDEDAIYFYQGRMAKELAPAKVADYPAIEGTALKIPGSAITGLELGPKPVVIMATAEGICVGTSGGTFINLTEKRLWYPSSRFGSALYNQNGGYIALLQP